MDSLKRIEDMLAAATPGLWEATRYVNPDGSEIKTKEEIFNVLKVSVENSDNVFLFGVHGKDPDEVVVCYTGNGPKSEANCIFIANAKDAIGWLISKVKDIEKQLQQERSASGALKEALAEMVHTHGEPCNTSGVCEVLVRAKQALSPAPQDGKLLDSRGEDILANEMKAWDRLSAEALENFENALQDGKEEGINERQNK